MSTTYVCNKCGYVGDSEIHAGCNYSAIRVPDYGKLEARNRELEAQCAAMHAGMLALMGSDNTCPECEVDLGTETAHEDGCVIGLALSLTAGRELLAERDQLKERLARFTGAGRQCSYDELQGLCNTFRQDNDQLKERLARFTGAGRQCSYDELQGLCNTFRQDNDQLKERLETEYQDRCRLQGEINKRDEEIFFLKQDEKRLRERVWIAEEQMRDVLKEQLRIAEEQLRGVNTGALVVCSRDEIDGLKERVRELEATVTALTPEGCLPPSWLEAEQLRRGVEELLPSMGEDERQQLMALLDKVTAADSLPVTEELATLKDELDKCRKDAELRRSEGYPNDWAMVTLMVSPDGRDFHAVAGEREPGEGDTHFIGRKRIIDRMDTLQEVASIWQSELSDFLAELESRGEMEIADRAKERFDAAMEASRENVPR